MYANELHNSLFNIGNRKETCMKEIYVSIEDFFSKESGDSFFRVNGYVHFS